MKTLERTDEMLMTAIARKDSAALEAIYDRYAPSALGLALKVLSDRPAAEEVVQEAFWRVWKFAATFDTRRGRFPAWLFGMVRNLAIDELRRRSAHPLSGDGVGLDDAALEIPDGAADVMETVWTSIKSVHVREAVEQLPDLQREVIMLAYFQGLTREEIAKRLGEPAGTIHTRARLALQKLRTIVDLEQVVG